MMIGPPRIAVRKRRYHSLGRYIAWNRRSRSRSSNCRVAGLTLDLRIFESLPV